MSALGHGDFLWIAAQAFGHGPCPNSGRCFTPAACLARGHCGGEPLTRETRFNQDGRPLILDGKQG